ncbi:HAD family hydrolase [Prosthecobacter dejongeii]|uniref:HAD superfamily hydrolase (TIGR01509 family) n=1 Tax=Prosthecobacter dejongeii TaxID=48465 RepID=A0A7W7YIZ2_9BACT|nr:HAD family phosphatase [Prosthecobacter dejongeii]MBB5037034.1 HAD superfamily hydrolase (TIGR01509 family) [Prosthecobacter dejongeii]
MLEIPDYPFRAYIFDCDGTLVDSMPKHYEAWLASLKLHGAPFDFTEEFFYARAGVREQDVVMELNEKYDSAIDPDAVAESKVEMFLKIIPQMEAIKPVADFARSLEGKFPMAVASGSEEIIVRGCLAASGLLHLFPVIVTPAYVKRGKPAPDMFLLAAEKLGVDPKECLVLEDGQAGIVAAEAAGMQWAFVPRTLR